METEIPARKYSRFEAGQVTGLTQLVFCPTKPIPGYAPIKQIVNFFQSIPERYQHDIWMEFEHSNDGTAITLHGCAPLDESDALTAAEWLDRENANSALYAKTIDELRPREKFGDRAVDAIKKHLENPK